MKKYIIIIAIAAISLVSCRKQAPYLTSPRDQHYIYTFETIFESFWNGMNNNYVFWSVDTTDWDAMYERYIPKVRALDEMEVSDADELHDAFLEFRNIIEAMTSGLIDGHLGITLKTDVLTPEESFFRPAQTRHEADKNYHTLEDFNTGWNKSLTEGTLYKSLKEYDNTIIHHTPAEAGSNPNDNFHLGVGLIPCADKNIVYLRIGGYCISTQIESDPEGEATQIMEKYYSYLKDTDLDLAGVIIDVRNNGGGRISDLNRVFGKLVNEETVFLYLRYKNGPNRLDYTPWIPQTLEMDKDRTRNITAPIVVLADVNSVSMAESTCHTAKALPNGVLMGERSWGGQGTLVNNNFGFENYHGGFIDNSFYQIYTTMTMSKSVDGNCYEGTGVKPDIEVLYDAAKFAQGEDTQLQAAIDHITQNQ